ncbi:MAG: hypothetical protein LBC18_05995, partial [Opitutaceae bacterium]|nr:hypothetical protein [Opitutaceae bacterium]
MPAMHPHPPAKVNTRADAPEKAALHAGPVFVHRPSFPVLFILSSFSRPTPAERRKIKLMLRSRQILAGRSRRDR